MDVVTSRFESFGFPLIVDDTIIPDDDTTLFVCSGMQRVRERFLTPDGSKHGSLQSCIRTNDLDLVGDGSHLTFFQMLGNFHFGGDYEVSVELWHSLLTDLSIHVDSIHYHPNSETHAELWIRRGYPIQPDVSCAWTDGIIGGYCCEVYSRGLEIGNLVHTLGHSVDVGFGWERIVQIMEGKERVDQTSLFSRFHPIVADHARTLEALWRHGIGPGNKHRNYVCRRLLRRMLRWLDGSEQFVFTDWLMQERDLREKRLREARRIWYRYQDKPLSWWWSTCGILPEEMDLIIH